MRLAVINMQASFHRALPGDTCGNGEGKWGGDWVMSDMGIRGSG